MKEKLLYLVLSGSIAAAGGAFIDVQKLKQVMNGIVPTVHENKSLLCLMAINSDKIERATVEKICVRK